MYAPTPNTWAGLEGWTDADGRPLRPAYPFTLDDASHFPDTREAYTSGYRAQLAYVNQLVLQTVDHLLATSESPPVIVLQGDHGPVAYRNLRITPLK